MSVTPFGESSAGDSAIEDVSRPDPHRDGPRFNLITLAAALGFIGLLLGSAGASQWAGVVTYLAVFFGVMAVGVILLAVSRYSQERKLAQRDDLLRATIVAALLPGRNAVGDSWPSRAILTEELVEALRLADEAIEAAQRFESESHHDA